MSDPQSPPFEGPPPATTVSGTGLAVGIVVGTIVLGVFTYYGVPQLVIPYFQAKPAQAEEFLDRIAAGVAAYKVDHGAFPPLDELNKYRRRNKNLLRSRSYGVYTYAVGPLTTPVAYINPGLSGDPYAMPEQTAPAAYFVTELPTGPLAILYSPGPNLIYNIRAADIRTLTTRDEVFAYLESKRYDPTNGTRSGGDLYRLLE
jgi:hypothetical protein